MGSTKKHILTIEDDEGMRSLLADFLTEEGYDADAVEKATYALKRILLKRFDLIITDIPMPTFSGLDILPELKRRQPNVPVIVITAFGGQEVYYQALSRGTDAYLEKPIQLQDLSALVHRMVVSKQG